MAKKERTHSKAPRLQSEEAPRALVRWRDCISKQCYKSRKKKYIVPIGRSTTGRDLYLDFLKTPHLLIGGCTGSGKSVFIHGIIASLMRTLTPDEVQFVLIDPKRVDPVLYKGSPYLLTEPIVRIHTAKQQLEWLNDEMVRRYYELERVKKMSITGYNKSQKAPMPHLFLVIDEYSDIRHAEPGTVNILTRLLQLSRAVGIHVILATSIVSNKVLPANLWANCLCHLAFKTANKRESKYLLFGVADAAQLNLNGDGIINGLNGRYEDIRFQAPFITEEEIMRLIA